VRNIARESTTLAIKTLRTIAADTDAPHAARVSSRHQALAPAVERRASPDPKTPHSSTNHLGWPVGGRNWQMTL